VPDGLLEDMKKTLDFILAVSGVEKKISVKVPKEGDFRKRLSEFLIKRDLIPLSLAEKSFSLEEAFVTITSENVERFAEIGGDS
jgi:hypothetical protein